jgi:hypothetical protein
MITATELRNRMPAARVLPDGFIDMGTAIEEILPMIEKEIIEMAGYGGHSTLIKKSEIAHYKLSGHCIASQNELMDGIAKALRKAKFSVSITNSYSSIHINW